MVFRKLCVLGLGYIGLPTASTFATHGLQVVGVDVNPEVVHTLRNGGVHIQEPGLRTLVQAALRSGNLTIQSQPAEADAFIIAVPTPFRENKLADLRAVEAAAQAIAPLLRKGNLVVLESTSPPLTTVGRVAPLLERSGLRSGEDFYLAYVPERVLPGAILRELIENDRVIGGVNRASAEAARDLYSLFVRGEILLTDATTAEMVKLMENTYRDVNIAIANEFARLAERFGVSVWEAIELANRHPRVNILRPGPGVGGHCISVDPWFLVEAAPELARLIRTAREVNDGQPHHVVELARLAFGELAGWRVAALGLAYKADVDDLRESPAIQICHLLQKAGAEVIAFEPYRQEEQVEGIRLARELPSALQGADLLAVLVAHRRFRSLSPSFAAQAMRRRCALDTVNLLQRAPWEKEGFKVVKLGEGIG
ncbi:MAG: nucleotide sugar dehydrogenase [Anaerolineales bacterium]|nr:nucleotide sugar dehydrogenase [Anaerolineales bacterium]MCS7249175.1 nucleotide sugar dehydrogenase [Anaerolineales bacterium]MDW8162988.1 nucleotide sugar dehydrogenase [Anaerolineales bacterium]MDW8446017.1 nucleotide sugar dehydrogenase [Anaerolineales bacterium]